MARRNYQNDDFLGLGGCNLNLFVTVLDTGAVQSFIKKSLLIPDMEKRI